MEEAVRRLDIKADRVEMDAWWMLITKGMKLIVCMLAAVPTIQKSGSRAASSGCVDKGRAEKPPGLEPPCPPALTMKPKRVTRMVH